MNICMRLSCAMLLVVSMAVSAGDDGPTFRDWLAADQAYKLDLVSGLIQSVKQNGTTLRLPAQYYVQELDSLVAATKANEGEKGLDQAVIYSFKTIAVMDCDWDNGQDRLDYAKKLMGPDIFAVFRKNYPDKYQRLAKGCR